MFEFCYLAVLKRVFSLLVSLLAIFSSLNAYSSFDVEKLRNSQTEAQALRHLPNQQLSLPFVIAQAALNSETYEIATSSALSIEAEKLRSQSILETKIIAETSLLDNRLETPSEVQPSRISSTNFKLGLEQGLRSGTFLSASINNQRTDQEIDFLPGLSSDTFETRLDVSVRQSLWRNSFGQSTRESLKAGELLTEAAKLDLQEAIEKWFVDFKNIFYNAWLAQANVRASQSSLERRQKLLEITEIRMRRGTAERPDLLQAQSAYIENESNLEKAKNDIDDIWRGLVVGLSLPMHWLKFDPMKIPLATSESQVSQTLDFCGTSELISSSPEFDLEQERLNLRSRAAKKALKVARDQLRPEASLFFTGSTNVIDDESRTETFSSLANVENNSFQVGLNLTIPLSLYSQRAEMKEALANERRLSAMSSQRKKEFQSHWVSQCSELFYRNNNVQSLKRVFENQKERFDLEQERFRIGRVPMISVIQAGDDAASAELNLRRAQHEFYIQSWKVRQLKNMIMETVESSVEKLESAQL